MPPPRRQPKKSSPLPFILGGVGLVLLVLCGGGVAGVYFLVIKPARDAVNRVVNNPNAPNTPPPVTVSDKPDLKQINSADDAVAALAAGPGRYEEPLKFLADSPPQPPGESDVSRALARYDFDRFGARHPWLAAVAVWGGPGCLPGVEKCNARFGVNSDRPYGKLVARCLARLGRKADAGKIVALHIAEPRPEPGAETLAADLRAETSAALLDYLNDPNDDIRPRVEAYFRGQSQAGTETARLFVRRSVADLNDREGGRTVPALRRLKDLRAALPAEKADVVFPLLDGILSGRWGGNTDDGVAALKAWLTKGDAVAVLVEIDARIKGDPIGGPADAYLLAAAYRLPETAPLLVKHLAHQRPDFVTEVVGHLRAMGPAAELALRAGLKADKEPIRDKSAQLLARLDGKPGVPPKEAPDSKVPFYKATLIRLKAETDAKERGKHLFALAVIDPEKEKATAADRKEVLEAVSAALDPKDKLSFNVAVRALARWATADHVALLVAAVKANPGEDWSPIIPLFGTWKSADAAPAVVASLANPKTHIQAILAVRQIGPAAEPELLKGLDPAKASDEVLLTLVRMLDDVGTPKAVPQLEAVSKHAVAKKNKDLVEAAESAVKMCRNRPKK